MATLQTPVNAAGVEREDDRDDAEEIAHGPFVVVETSCAAISYLNDVIIY